MNRNVLIADADSARAGAVAMACRDAGLSCRSVPHGAAALEVALHTRPGLVVAQGDLPLVDAAKLSEILRANPRTHRARFVFLGGGGLAASGVGDCLLPGGADAAEILRVVRDSFERQDRFDVLESAVDYEGEVAGELAQLPLPDLLQGFHFGARSGSLELTRAGSDGRDERGRITLRDGEIVRAEVGSVDREKALFRLLSWREGHFAMHGGAFDEEPARILTPTRPLLAEGHRQQTETLRLAGQLPAIDASVRLRVKPRELPHLVHPLTEEVLLLLELYHRVRDVVDHCSYPDYQVLRTLHTLSARGLVEIGRRSEPALPEACGALYNGAQTRRLSEWIRANCGTPETAVDAKLLIASSDPATMLDFASLLARVPDVALSPLAEQRSIGERDLESLGRLRVDDESGVELLHLPIDESAAPLWPVAGHGALGTVFLLAGPVSEAVSRLAPAREALRSLARSRVFYVIVLRKGERISPDELRENLSLIDESSLFLLPLESPKEPVSLLRSLFARLVP